MKIEVLGVGSSKCDRLADNVQRVATCLGLDYHLHKVADEHEATRRGISITPALVIDGQLTIAGRVPSDAELIALLSGARAEA